MGVLFIDLKVKILVLLNWSRGSPLMWPTIESLE